MSLRLLPPEEKSRLLIRLAEDYGVVGLDGLEVLEGGDGFWAAAPAVIGLPLRKLRTDSVGILLARGGNPAPTIAALQLFARPTPTSINLSQADASAFVDRRIIAVDAPDGRHVVFCGGHALDLGRVKDGRLGRVESRPPRG